MRSLRAMLQLAVLAPVALAHLSVDCLDTLGSLCGTGGTGLPATCDVCAGQHQHELRASGCSATDVHRWCDGRPDPHCAHGIRSGTICCAKKCGECGGNECGILPGGSSNCCSGKIRASHRSCATASAPCVIGGTPTPAPSPPAPLPIAPITVTITGGSVIANVAPEYVSYNFDTSSLTGLNLATPSPLATLAHALSPAHLRVGGTQGDYEVYAFGDYERFDCTDPPYPMTDYRCKTMSVAAWGDLLDFAAYANVSLLFGLNDLFMRPTKTKPEVKRRGADGKGPLIL